MVKINSPDDCHGIKGEVFGFANNKEYNTAYRTFSGYVYRSGSYYSTPGYYSTTKTFTIETTVYSIKEDKIIWTRLTKTTNPDGVQKLTEDVAKVVYKKMVKEVNWLTG